MAATATETAKPKVPKVPYRKANGPKIDGLPSGFSSTKHEPLKKEDFKEDAMYYDWKADSLEKSAGRYRVNAELCRTFGDEEQRKAAIKLDKTRRAMQEMQSKLEEQFGPEVVKELLARMDASTGNSTAA